MHATARHAAHAPLGVAYTIGHWACWPASTVSLHTTLRVHDWTRYGEVAVRAVVIPHRPILCAHRLADIARASPDVARTQSDVDRQQTGILRPSVNVGPVRLDVAHTSLAVEHQLTASGCI
ncbi:hypothetical protein BKA62DRAFT_775318 [Auriculariales sp. MPI-PUGE-AT-0066]|nr:hypothetical protein BKA62DRAFT_775318 [Auriculariales sp. MPI-PUGE-AT-0066]